jgi:hypothetical protein
MIKIAMVGAVSLAMVLASTAANAEPVRAAASMPVVVSAKKLKPLRKTAPASRESRATVNPVPIVIGVLSATALGLSAAASAKEVSPAG